MKLKSDDITVNFDFFDILKENEISSINSTKSINTYQKGDHVFNEGYRAHGVFIILSGKIKLVRMIDNGREQIIRFYKENDLIGYRALLGDELFNCTGVALEKTQICFIPKSTFLNLFETNHNFAYKIIHLLSFDLKLTEKKLTLIAQKSVKELIIDALLNLKDFFGLDDDGYINISLTREEFANIAGTATETAIRILSTIKNEGLVEFKGKKIKILNLK